MTYRFKNITSTKYELFLKRLVWDLLKRPTRYIRVKVRFLYLRTQQRFFYLGQISQPVYPNTCNSFVSRTRHVLCPGPFDPPRLYTFDFQLKPKSPEHPVAIVFPPLYKQKHTTRLNVLVRVIILDFFSQ